MFSTSSIAIKVSSLFLSQISLHHFGVIEHLFRGSSPAIIFPKFRTVKFSQMPLTRFMSCSIRRMMANSSGPDLPDGLHQFLRLRWDSCPRRARPDRSFGLVARARAISSSLCWPRRAGCPPGIRHSLSRSKTFKAAWLPHPWPSPSPVFPYGRCPGWNRQKELCRPALTLSSTESCRKAGYSGRSWQCPPG